MTKLCKENSQLATEVMSNLRQLLICMNCGHRETVDQSLPTISLSNEKQEFSKNLSVTLRIAYICEGDQLKKYELRLKPGEYAYSDIMARIRDKVSQDRYYVKLQKRTFILVDMFEHTQFGQLL